MKKVLIALDYDPTAQKVAEEGFSLAQAMKAEVILIHVIADPVYYSSREYNPIMGFGGYIDRDFLQSDVQDGLNKASQHFLNKSKQHLGDDTIQTQVKEGDFAESILAAAEEVKADCIVMGSHSRRWLESIIMGSVTEKVLHQTTIPLCIIPTKKGAVQKLSAGFTGMRDFKIQNNS
jgi:nucleotide-binding universal stress UspA family protein